MATVPYSSVPTAETQAAPTQGLSVRTTPDMFGGAVGSALSQFGSTAEHAGDEVFARANAMQQMVEETKARQAQVQFDQQSAQSQADFTAKEGLNAGPEALAAHSAQLAQMRSDLSNSLSSPYAKQHFDSESMPFLGRLIFSSAGHSGQQMKVAYDGTLQSQIASSRDNALQNANDDLAFKGSLQTTTDAATNFASSHGYSPEQTQQYVTQQTSALTASRIMGAIKGDPLRANKLFADAQKAGALRGEDAIKLQPMIDAMNQTRSSRVIADSTMDGSNLALGSKVIDGGRAANAIGTIESGGNYTLRGPTVEKGMYAGQQALGKYQVMPDNLPGFLKQAGLGAMTPEQFLANPAAQDKVFQSVFGDAMAKYGNFNDAASVWFTGKPMAQVDPNTSDGHTTVPDYIRRANAVLTRDAGPQELVAAGRAQASKLTPDPLVGDNVEQHILAQTAQQKKLATQQQQAVQGTIDTAIAGARGATPANLDDLGKTDPKVAEAIQSLDGPGRLKVQRQLAQAQAADNVPSPERDANWNKLVGEAQNDPDAYMSRSPYDQNLTADQRKAMTANQGKLRQGGLTDTTTGHAMKTLTDSGQLVSAGLVADGKPLDKDDYNIFTGKVHDEINQYKLAHGGTPPNPEQVKAIGSRLLSDEATSKGYLWDSTTKNYQLTVPPDTAAKLKKLLGPTASDAQVRQAYARATYNASAK